jgi:DNA polymerase-3 subunit epsilon
MTLQGQRSFDELGTPLAEVPFCVLDLETTGLSPDRDEITEIGAALYRGGVEIGRFQTLVNPGTGIPPSVTVITGITQAMVIDAPGIAEALPSFLEFLGESVIVGHNVRFDMSFLNAASIRLGYGRLPHRHADTLRLARRLVRNDVRNMQLSSLAAHFGSPVTPTHRALDDALATAHVFWSLLERAGSIGVTHLDDLLALPTIKGSRAIGKLAMTEGLPRRPGVYTFRDRTGTVIYVGKATNLRSRVRSYFSGDTRRRIDNILRDLDRIEHRETCAEIEAAVLELRSIAEHTPLYNRRSKPPRSMHWVQLTDERFPRLSITRSPGSSRLIIGPFRSRVAAERVLHALWDASRIRRCTGPGRGCGFAEITSAVCPCDGTITPTQYGAIVDELIAGIDAPAVLAEKLAERMNRLAELERFEDAAAVRDRWSSLSRALERSVAWTALETAGRIEASSPDGVTLAITRARLEAAWRTGETPPMTVRNTAPARAHPPTMLASDEVMLLWAWLNRPGVRLREAEHGLSLPAGRIVYPTTSDTRSQRRAEDREPAGVA